MTFIKGHKFGKRFTKGQVPWNKGVTGYSIHSSEWKSSLSKKFKGRISPMKGKHHSSETKERLSEANKGRVVSEKQKLLLKQRTGSKNPMFGKTHSEEYKQKLKDKWLKENNPRWKGGLTSERELRLTNSSWHKLKIEVYKRDNYTCQICLVKCIGSKKGGKNIIQAHHLEDWNGENDKLDNLITVCLSCHTKLHNNQEFRRQHAS